MNAYSSQDKALLEESVELSLRCLPSPSCFRVGAVIITADGRKFTGYTHETGTADHAEESAINKAMAAGADLKNATIYSSLEPCSTRKSKECSCTDLIIRNGFSKVIFAMEEPVFFVDCQGTELLEKAGIHVIHIPGMEQNVREINSHLHI